MNYDVAVPNPKRKFVFRGIGVAGRFAGGPIFYIQAETHFCGHRGVSCLALNMGGQDPIHKDSDHLRLKVGHGTVTETESR